MIIYTDKNYKIKKIDVVKKSVLTKKDTLDLIINYYNSAIKDDKKVKAFGYTNILKVAISIYEPEFLEEGFVWQELQENI